MKAWQVQRLADPREALELTEVEEPSAAEGEVVVEVEAAALNFFDILLCRGEYQEKPDPPFTPGAEVSGTVVGPGSGYSGGEQVIAMPPLPRGGLAQRVSVPATAVLPAPEGMPADKAAAMHIVYQTAHFALHRRAALRAAETVLVHAGAGGVGSAAIQLAAAAGARVVATAGGPEKVEVCRELGAEVALDYREEEDLVGAMKEATGGRGADVIFDPVGGDIFDASRRCVAFEGRIVVVGFAGGRIAEAPTNHALVKNYSVVGLHWGLYNRVMPELPRQVHDELCALYAAGSIDPLIYDTFDFEEVPDALEKLGGRRTYGKVVVRP